MFESCRVHHFGINGLGRRYWTPFIFCVPMVTQPLKISQPYSIFSMQLVAPD